MKWAVFGLLIAACGTSSVEPATPAGSTEPVTATNGTTSRPADICADVVDASAELAADGTYTFTVTVRSPDTGWDKYADAWEVRARDGAVLDTRVLTHPHETEQPFTRSLDSVAVPDGVDTVVIAARDSVEGFCGEEFELSL